MNSAELAQAFLNHTPIAGVQFEHNDDVKIISGSYSGGAGSLVTVLSLSPEPKFLLELESGRDVEVFQSEICRAES